MITPTAKRLGEIEYQLGALWVAAFTGDISESQANEEMQKLMDERERLWALDRINKTAEQVVEIDLKIRNLELATIYSDLPTRCLAKDEIEELEEERDRLWALARSPEV